MAIEIIKPGIIPDIVNAKYKTTCDKCGCVFTYTGEDIRSARRIDDKISLVYCPTEKCNNIINHSESFLTKQYV